MKINGKRFNLMSVFIGAECFLKPNVFLLLLLRTKREKATSSPFFKTLFTCLAGRVSISFYLAIGK